MNLLLSKLECLSVITNVAESNISSKKRLQMWFVVKVGSKPFLEIIG
jgi:hypothetical protein